MFETFQVTMAELNHPQGCTGWRLQERAADGSYTGPSLVIATDTEHFNVLNPHLDKLLHKADLAILDGQYSDDEYLGTPPDFNDSKVGWGHGTPRSCLMEACASEVKTLAITHHDPANDDKELSSREEQLRFLNKRLKKPVQEVLFLREGQEFHL